MIKTVLIKAAVHKRQTSPKLPHVVFNAASWPVEASFFEFREIKGHVHIYVLSLS